MIEANFKKLSNSNVEICMDIIEYAWPKSVAGCWKKLDELLGSDRITQATYDDIKAAVTFEEVES